MRSVTTARASGTARRASNSPAARALARAGLTARGVLYILIGWVAILVALGQTSQEADQQGALQLLASQPYGRVSLWLLGIGFTGYALWRLSEAAFGVTGDGNGAGPRLKSLVRAVIYAFFAYLTFKIISGAGGGSQATKQQDLTATVMHHTGGRWLVGLVGLVIVVAGLVLVGEGLRRRFLKYLRLGQTSPRTRRIVEWLGVSRDRCPGRGVRARRDPGDRRGRHVSAGQGGRHRQGPADASQPAVWRVSADPRGAWPDHLRCLRAVRSALAEGLESGRPAHRRHNREAR